MGVVLTIIGTSLITLPLAWVLDVLGFKDTTIVLVPIILWLGITLLIWGYLIADRSD